MKILFLGDARSPHLKRWLSSLTHRGHDVHLGTLYPQAMGERMKRISAHDISSRGNFLRINFFEMWRKAFAMIRSIRPHVLHAHYVNGYGWVGALSKFHPFVLTVWGGDILSDQGAFRKWGSKPLTQWALQRADAVTADSPNLIDACVSLGKDRSFIHEVTFGIEIDSFARKPDISSIKKGFGIPSDSFVVFSPRRVDRLMNIDTIIKSIPLVVGKFPRIIFLIKIFPGQFDEGYLKEIRALSETLGVENYLRYCDDPEDQTMLDCYQIADVVVSIPSSDGMPATVFEAMASRTPLIVSDLPAYNGVVMEGESGLRVSLRDENRLAQAILNLLTDGIKRERLKERGFQIVKEKGNLENEIDKVENLYLSLVRKKMEKIC